MQSHLSQYLYLQLAIYEYLESKQDTEIHQYIPTAIQGSNCTNCDQLPAAARQSLQQIYYSSARAYRERTQQTIKFHNNVSNPHLDQFCNADAANDSIEAASMSLL